MPAGKPGLGNSELTLSMLMVVTWPRFAPQVAQRAVAQQSMGLRTSFLILLFLEGREGSALLPETMTALNRPAKLFQFKVQLVAQPVGTGSPHLEDRAHHHAERRPSCPLST
jgi:hypothetical protein